MRIKNRATKRKILFRAVISFLDNDLITSSAAITYFGMLALFPTLLLALSIAQAYFDESIRRELLSRLPAYMPGTAEFVTRNLEAISNVSPSLLITAFTILLWAGSWIFTVIERAMCRMWGTQPRSFLHGRLLTIGMIAAVGVVLLASLLVTSGVVTIQTLIERLPVKQVPTQIAWLGSMLWQIVLFVVSWLVTTSLFALIYRIMPNTRISLIEVVPGALIAGLLWEVAKYGFAWMIPYFHYDLLYGSIGAGVALLTWSYLSSLVMLFGAQLTAVLHCRRLFGEDMGDEEE
ncbi:MAG: YihY/virulence factor BrkB family protein [Acidobacteria bacterium]|nr:YihY/virulence factor BrkB family protein [Acidobacteriota bacterium]